MRNFYEASSEAGLLNFKKYFQELYKTLDLPQKEDIDCEENRTTIQRLASNSYKIWKSFNEDRALLDKYYMDTWLNLQSYAASFLVPNIERVFSLLSGDQYFYHLKKVLENNPEEFALLDFGSGPLSATTGALAALAYAKENGVLLPKKITVFAIERSDKSYELGKKLILEALQSHDIQVTFTKIPSPEKIPQKVHLVLAANIFNEIPQKHHQKTFQTLFSFVEEKGLLLVLEPGQEVHARALSALRDCLLTETKDAANLKILGPCLHNKPCPLGEKVARKDWCWFRHSWNPPLLLSLLSKFSKIDYHELNFSYLFLEKNAENSAQVEEQTNLLGRCVSDPFAVDLLKTVKLIEYVKNNVLLGKIEDLENRMIPDERIQKILLCTQAGTLESEYFQSGNVQGLRKRGTLVQFEELVTLRVAERVEAKS